MYSSGRESAERSNPLTEVGHTSDLLDTEGSVAGKELHALILVGVVPS